MAWRTAYICNFSNHTLLTYDVCWDYWDAMPLNRPPFCAHHHQLCSRYQRAGSAVPLMSRSLHRYAAASGVSLTVVLVGSPTTSQFTGIIHMSG
jgi:hypothetical protein